MLRAIRTAWRKRLERAAADLSLRERSALLAAKGFKAEDALVLTGDPRGGTTWLMEVLSAWTGTAVNWEPLHHAFGVVPEAMRWGKRPFIPERDRDPERLAMMRELLSSQRTTEWTLRYCTREQALGAERILTKFVRANLLLPWMTATIAFKRKPILLLRHPIPTVLSQLKAFPNAAHSEPTCTVPDQIFNERFAEHLDYLNSLTPGIERTLALWCVNNLTTLRHPRHGRDWVVVHYEELLFDPVVSLERIAAAWGVSADPWIDYARSDKSSATDFTRDRLSDPAAQVAKWMQRIDKGQAARLQSILDHFGIDEYSLGSARPSDQASR
jgi:hypothetical protein